MIVSRRITWVSKFTHPVTLGGYYGKYTANDQDVIAEKPRLRLNSENCHRPAVCFLIGEYTGGSGCRSVHSTEPTDLEAALSRDGMLCLKIKIAMRRFFRWRICHGYT